MTRSRAQIPIEPAAPRRSTSRDFVPWRFSDACRRRAWMGSSCRRPKTCTEADSCGAADVRSSFDHLIGAGEQRRRHLKPQRLRSLEIDHQLVFGWALHRKIGRFLALEDAIDVARPRADIDRQFGAIANRPPPATKGVQSRSRATCAGPQVDDQIRDVAPPTRCRQDQAAIREPAKAVDGSSISPASLTLMGINSTRSDAMRAGSHAGQDPKRRPECSRRREAPPHPVAGLQCFFRHRIL